MKRLHIHVAVEDLAASIGFYSKLFAAPPTVAEPDYAKWMLDDPRVNFAISTRGGTPGSSISIARSGSGVWGIDRVTRSARPPKRSRS